MARSLSLISKILMKIFSSLLSLFSLIISIILLNDWMTGWLVVSHKISSSPAPLAAELRSWSKCDDDDFSPVFISYCLFAKINIQFNHHQPGRANYKWMLQLMTELSWTEFGVRAPPKKAFRFLPSLQFPSILDEKRESDMNLGWWLLTPFSTRLDSAWLGTKLQFRCIYLLPFIFRAMIMSSNDALIWRKR